ncbi:MULTISPECIES: FecR family protein [Asaia]|uniref:FecR family protein n=1 Tax=Asaia TaxID=91914 RepID=UPI002553E141|nr:DUF4880 domain-containing protein [Asaia sp. HumB]MDL2172098.1 DUF4880 domain-containing protein [Asaia sp. HumB]
MTPAEIEQAANWQARLMSDRCSDLDRRRFDAWLEEKEAHHQAYNLVSQIWQGGQFARSRQGSVSLPLSRRGVVAGIVGLGASLGVAANVADARTICTGRGEHRRVMASGLRVEMDACSSLVIAPRTGRMVFEAGRYEVMAAPFGLQAQFGCCSWAVSGRGGRYALDVTNAAMTLAVLEGSARLEKPGASHVVQAGQVFAYDRQTRLVTQRPGRLDDLLAWREGRAVFHGTPLAQALNEMARYSDRPVRLVSPSLAPLRISGVFHTHDPARFFRALAHLLPLRVVFAPDLISVVQL